MNDTFDPRPLYARATDQAAALLKTVRPEQLNGPTPCAEFDVRRLVSHLAGGARRVAVIGEGGDGMALPAFLDDVPDDGWPAAFDEARVRAQRAWADDARLAAPVRAPWGESPGQVAMAAYVMECVTHTWDLSEALGHPLELDPELGEFALATARRMLPDERREAPTPFDSAQPAPEGADVYGELAAWLGRKPLSPA